MRIYGDKTVMQIIEFFECKDQSHWIDENCSVSVPATGVYMVKVGDHPARRVVVMR